MGGEGDDKEVRKKQCWGGAEGVLALKQKLSVIGGGGTREPLVLVGGEQSFRDGGRGWVFEKRGGEAEGGGRV